MQSQVFPSVSNLINTWQLPEQSILLTTDKTALELLQTKTIATPISSFALQQTLIGMSEYNALFSLTVKEFIVNYLSYSKTAVVGCVTVKPVQKEDSGDSSSSSADAEFGEFDYTQSAAFTQGKTAFMLSAADTVALNYVKQGITKGGLNLNDGDMKFRIELENQKCRKKRKLNRNGAKVVVYGKTK
jgi:hypothetical protein